MEFLSGFRGILGIAAIIGVLVLMSENRKAISWRLVITGMRVMATSSNGGVNWKFVVIPCTTQSLQIGPVNHIQAMR